MSKQEDWEQLGFASYRDWRLFDASERRKRKRAVALPPTSTSQPVPPSPTLPPIPAPSLPFQLPPRAQLLPEYDANDSAEEFKSLHLASPALRARQEKLPQRKPLGERLGLRECSG